MLWAHPNCMCHLKPVAVSQLIKGLPYERFEQGARDNIYQPHQKCIESDCLESLEPRRCKRRACHSIPEKL